MPLAAGDRPKAEPPLASQVDRPPLLVKPPLAAADRPKAGPRPVAGLRWAAGPQRMRACRGPQLVGPLPAHPRHLPAKPLRAARAAQRLGRRWGARRDPPARRPTPRLARLRERDRRRADQLAPPRVAAAPDQPARAPPRSPQPLLVAPAAVWLRTVAPRRLAAARPAGYAARGLCSPPHRWWAKRALPDRWALALRRWATQSWPR